MMRSGMALGLGLAAAGAAFLIYSAATTFSHWPWTVSREVEGEAALGFTRGDTKQECLARAIDLERSGRIAALVPLDAVAESGSRFVGTGLTPADLARLEPSDRWHVGIAGENAWLILEFAQDHLARVLRSRYRGPTE